LRTQAEDAIAELVALGLANSDSFSGLRALLVPSERRSGFSGARRRRRTVAFGIEDAGRWALLRRNSSTGGFGHPSSGRTGEYQEAVEHAARTLLRRYGVVFLRILEREPKWLPPWRELLRVYRRLEARGEIRGGRFVAGVPGEQFAFPEAIGLLREVRRRDKTEALVSVSGADPLNLLGTIVPGPRLPALTGNRVLYRDGVPLALLSGGEASFLQALEAREQWQARNALIKRQVPPVLAYLG